MKLSVFIPLSFIFAVGFGILQVFISLKTTRVGYDIGALKHEEVILLRQKSVLAMKLAKLTTKSSLTAVLNRQSANEKE